MEKYSQPCERNRSLPVETYLYLIRKAIYRKNWNHLSCKMSFPRYGSIWHLEQVTRWESKIRLFYKERRQSLNQAGLSKILDRNEIAFG